MVVSVCIQKANAQNCNYNYLGTKNLYTAPAYKNSPVPAGYQPLFINHVGRHGARHLTKEVNTSFAYTFLASADTANKLTAAGKQLWAYVKALDKVEHGNVKSISGEGADELKGIGKRMYAHYPQVFAGTPKMSVGFTKEIRTKQSADAFLTGLKPNFKSEPTIREYPDDTDLRFFDASPAYTAFEENGNWQQSMNLLQQKLNYAAVNKQIAEKWLVPAYLKTLKASQIEKLVGDVFGFATILPSLKVEMEKVNVKAADVNFASLFTCDELTVLSKVDVADDYLKKAPGTDLNGIQIKVAAPLLADFITAVDDFAKHPDTCARLRFAHAETISPFATILGISQASVVAKDITQLDAAWKSSEIIPLSSNIQWIVYQKKGSKDLLVKVLLNEQEVYIAGLPKTSYYYKWPVLRAFYLKKLAALKLGLTDDRDAFLKNVK